MGRSMPALQTAPSEDLPGGSSGSGQFAFPPVDQWKFVGVVERFEFEIHVKQGPPQVAPMEKLDLHDLGHLSLRKPRIFGIAEKVLFVPNEHP